MNKTLRILLTTCLAFIMWSGSFAQVRKYGLEDVIALARGQSPASKVAETRKENLYWQYRVFKTNYNPQLRLSGRLPSYTKNYFQNTKDDGTVEYQQRERATSNLTLGLEQPFALTGGLISANTNLERLNDYENNFNQWSGTLMGVSFTQPLFQLNPYKWDRRTEPLKYEESKRGYVEEMESLSSNAVARYFAVLDAQINLQIAEFNLANNDTIYKIEEGRYNIGTTPRDKLLQAELQLLRSRQDVTQAKIDLQTAKLRFRSYLGIKDDEQFELNLPEQIPGLLYLNEDDALDYARKNRADFIAFERRKIEAEREVANARGQKWDVNLTAQYGLSGTSVVVGDLYNGQGDKLTSQVLDIGISFPIVDWGRNKARVQTALANKKLNDYIIAQDEITFEQEVITQVRQFEVLLSQIEITKKSDEVAQERYLVSQNRYLIGKIDITNLNIALTEKDAAKRSYLAALRAFWTAYYDLRRLTLYDFTENRLLYTPED